MVLPKFLYKDHMINAVYTLINEKIRRKIQAAIGEYDDLIALVKDHKLRWFSMLQDIGDRNRKLDWRSGI